MEQGNFNEATSLSAQAVANAFVEQYYGVMQKLPQDAHKFYKEQSTRSHPCADGSMKSATTLRGIDDEIMAFNVLQWIPDLTTVYAQDSVMKSVIVGVSGTLTDNADVERNFAQTFILAPQEGGGFYVHNDVLQFVDIITPPDLDDLAELLTAQQANDTEKEGSLETAHATNKDETNKSTSKKEDGGIKNEVAESSKGKNKLTVESKKKNQTSVRPSVWKPVQKMNEAKQVSYASILAKEGARSSTAPPPATNSVLEKTEKLTTASPDVPKPSVFPARSSPVPNSGSLENIYDVKSIRVKNLPLKITKEALLETVKQFGPVKKRNIQIKAYPDDGYCYAFVEFDNPKSASNALEARFIYFDGRYSEIQYKILHNQAMNIYQLALTGGHNYAGRPPYGQGGYRNDNFRGRDGEGGGSNEHDNPGQYYGQTRDYNYGHNRYSQAHY